jgi:hypothetical protein
MSFIFARREPRRIEMPTFDQKELIRFVRRSALFVLPAIALVTFAGLVVWTVRRQIALTDEIAVEPIVDYVEPAYEVPA